jgi:DNA-binding NarL/FixJ family response regulator
VPKTPYTRPVRTYGAGGVRRNGMQSGASTQNSRVNPAATTVLVAVESAQVREALVAMLGALEQFHLVAEADNDEAAVDAARRLHPDLALIEPELSNCGGWWAIKQIQTERLAGTVVALGRRADCGGLADLVGAQTYVQMGTTPRDLLSALEAAMGTGAETRAAVTTAK